MPCWRASIESSINLQGKCGGYCCCLRSAHAAPCVCFSKSCAAHEPQPQQHAAAPSCRNLSFMISNATVVCDDGSPNPQLSAPTPPFRRNFFAAAGSGWHYLCGQSGLFIDLYACIQVRVMSSCVSSLLARGPSGMPMPMGNFCLDIGCSQPGAHMQGPLRPATPSLGGPVSS